MPLVGVRRALLGRNELGKNLLVNPQLANNAAGWAIGSVTITQNGPNGANSVAMLGTGSASFIYCNQNATLVVGGWYVLSGWFDARNVVSGKIKVFLNNPPYTSANLDSGSGFASSSPFRATQAANNILLGPYAAAIANGLYAYISLPSLVRIA